MQTSGEPSLLGLSRVQPEITSEASNFRNEELGIKDSVTEPVDVRDSVPEPVDELMTEGNNVPEHFDFVLVPGVAFSPNGYRLGRGKGFYDKFLSKHPLYTVGVCFREQFYLDIPFEPHDVPMNKVLVI